MPQEMVALYNPADGTDLLGQKVAAGSVPVVLSSDVGLPAAEAHLGEVGGPLTVITVTPTITAGAYNATTTNSVGGKQTLANVARVSGGLAILQSLVVLDKANQKAALTILIFDADPIIGTYTDHGQVLLSTDLAKVIRKINITAGDYETIDASSGTDPAIADISAIAKVVKPAAGRDLYFVVVNTGAPTYASTSDLTFRFGFLQQ